MNRTIRNLIIAVPLAAAGFTMVGATAATAGPNGPVIIIQPNGGDPEPKPDFPIKDAPKPKGPQDKAPLPKDNGPKDKAPKPAAKPQPQGGTQTAAPTAARSEVETKKKAAKAVVEVVSAKGSPDSIDRSDDLFAVGAFETELVAQDTDGGLDLTWLLIGGGIVTASGIAFAARKRSNA